ncbi:cytochrome P450 [Streptomyces sp. CRN 30]|uniref:cytochrome P450 n=1 Tax=Streptomyces sp. CRN 30 TaxID=3075613 RepID=UPI002A83C6B3|nr:cytochrome P450 [Streptomyces sp. CRN 30]
MESPPEPLTYPFRPGPGPLPNPVFAELRERPLVRVRMAYGEEAWLATRYADVKTVMSDPRFSVAEAVGRDHPRTHPLAGAVSGMFSLDPPEHTRVRGLVSKELSARRIAGLRDRANQLAEGLLDRMVEEGGPVDLVDRFAIPFPTAMLCNLLGVPDEDHRRFWDWAVGKLSGTATDDELRTESEEFVSYVVALFEARRREPRDDLFSCVLRAREADSRVTEKEMLALAGDLLMAGFLTVSHQIAICFHQLLLRPGELRRLRDRPALIPAAVEELLRYVQLINFLPPRYATEDIELGEVLVRAGDPVLVATAAANRDPAVFPDGEELRLDRSGPPHLGFGQGTHYCLGAHLARMELQVSLETVLRRLPGLRLAVPEDELRWMTGGMVLGLRTLPVTFDADQGTSDVDRCTSDADRGTPGARSVPDAPPGPVPGEQPGPGPSCPRSSTYPAHP